MAAILPIPPRGSSIDSEEYRRYLLSIENAVSGAVAPIDAQYWVSTSNSELTNERNIGTLATGYLKVTTAIGVATPSSTPTIPGTDITGAALSKTDDTNVTLTLGGTPVTALLRAVSLTLGWTGLLGLARGGTNANLSATGGTGQVLKQSTAGGAVTVGTLPASDIASGAALTRVDDTNVTATLGGTPASALLKAVSITLGWTGLLAVARGGTGVDNTTQAYTPTATAATNLDATPTPTAAQYLRVGNTVTVSGRFTADPTLTATATSFELSLPIASNVGTVADVAGVAFCGAIAGQGAAISGSIANDTAVVSWLSGDVTSQAWSYTYTYRVIL